METKDDIGSIVPPAIMHNLDCSIIYDIYVDYIQNSFIETYERSAGYVEFLSLYPFSF